MTHLHFLRFRNLASWFAVVILVGCEREPIQHYQVERIEKPKPAAADPHAGHAHGAVASRMLAAIIPKDNRAWFLKLVGPADRVAPHKAAFDAFTRSIRFTDDSEKPMKWTVPEGWKELPGERMRYASFQIGTDPDTLELTVIPLGGAAGGVLANVNRWRQQIGLEPIAEGDLGTCTTQIDLDGVQGTLVDLVGPGAHGTAAHAPSATASAPAAQSPGQGTATKPLSYKTPGGWQEEAASGMRVATFKVDQGDQQAELTVIPLAGAAGDLLGNVNRWRGQIGLGPVDMEQLQKDTQQATVGGLPGHYFDMIGPESARAERERMLAVIVTRAGKTWFFKMKGPAGLMAAQQDAFRAFINSVQFNGG